MEGGIAWRHVLKILWRHVLGYLWRQVFRLHMYLWRQVNNAALPCPEFVAWNWVGNLVWVWMLEQCSWTCEGWRCVGEALASGGVLRRHDLKKMSRFIKEKHKLAIIWCAHFFLYLRSNKITKFSFVRIKKFTVKEFRVEMPKMYLCVKWVSFLVFNCTWMSFDDWL